MENSISEMKNTSLEYDERYISIQNYFEEDSNFMNDSENSNTDISIENIIVDSKQLLQQSADLSVACWLLRAELKVHGLQAFFRGIRRIHDLIIGGGIHLHPIAEDGHPCSSHASALAWLATTHCLNSLHAAPLSASNSRTTLKDLLFLINTGKKNPETARKQRELISHLNEESLSQGYTSFAEALSNSIAMLDDISQKTNSHAIGYTLNIDSITRTFRNVLADMNNHGENNSNVINLQNQTTTAVNPGNSCFLIKNQFQSREDVITQLEEIINYFKIHEPGHPAPIFIRRVQKMIGMDFESIITELIPEASPALSKFTGQ